MKFAITPLENKQIVFKDDVEKYKEQGLLCYQDIYDEKHREWHRIYSDILIIPSYAKSLYTIGKESIYLHNGYNYPEEYRFHFQKNNHVIVYKKDLRDYSYLKLNDDNELYYYH